MGKDQDLLPALIGKEIRQPTTRRWSPHQGQIRMACSKKIFVRNVAIRADYYFRLEPIRSVGKRMVASGANPMVTCKFVKHLRRLLYMGSDFGSVGRVVTFETRDPQFKPHRIESFCKVNLSDNYREKIVERIANKRFFYLLTTH